MEMSRAVRGRGTTQGALGEGRPGGTEVLDVRAGAPAQWCQEPPVRTWSVFSYFALVLCWPLGMLALEYSRAAGAASAGGSRRHAQRLGSRALVVSGLAAAGACLWVVVAAAAVGTLTGHLSVPEAPVLPGTTQEAPQGVYV
jgi:hypothetical protein